MPGEATVLSYLSDSFQVRLSPLLFLESTETPDSPQDICSASLVETGAPPVEDTTVAPVPRGFRHCFLYPGPGGGYGFRLSCVASGPPHLFISQVTDAPGTPWIFFLEVGGCTYGHMKVPRLGVKLKLQPRPYATVTAMPLDP